MFQGQTPGYGVPAVLKEYLDARASGQLVCRTEGVAKTINLWHGQVTSAGSTLIDDRLGEVIYREGRLTLDTFVDAAGKVTKQLRFGDLLIKSGIFTPVDLYDALASQSRAIMSSLVFYPLVEVEFKENATPPKLELPLGQTLDDMFEDALGEFRYVQLFEREARALPALAVDEEASYLANNDFFRDVLGLVRETPDFAEVVDKTSRLSKPYTVRALFELYLRGVIKDTWGFARKFLSGESAGALAQVVEEGNFLLTELAGAARREQIDGWENILFGSNEILSRELGFGHYLAPDSFVHDNILRSAVLRKPVRRSALARFEHSWPATFVEYVHDALTHGLIYVLFELFNRRFQSQEFARVRVLMQDMRGGKTV